MKITFKYMNHLIIVCYLVRYIREVDDSLSIYVGVINNFFLFSVLLVFADKLVTLISIYNQ